MEVEGTSFSCQSCGRKVECSLGEPPCRVLTGWLIVAYWKGLGSVEHYNFCSFNCLQKWADSQVTKIPEVFLKYCREDEGEDTAGHGK